MLFNSEHVFVGGEFAFKTFSATAFSELKAHFWPKNESLKKNQNLYYTSKFEILRSELCRNLDDFSKRFQMTRSSLTSKPM